MDDKVLRAKLAAPISGFKWRLQQTAPKDAKKPYPQGTKGLFMAFIDARDLYDRLDDVFGVGGWTRRVKAVNADGSVVGCLSVKIGETWIDHEDIGYSNEPGAAWEKEPLKAAASDAFKRAGVGLGVGRFLYNLDAKWVLINEWGQPADKRLLSSGVVEEPHETAQPPAQADLPARDRTTTQNTVPQQTQAYMPPAASNGGSQAATPRQLKFIQAIAREHGMSDDEVESEVEQLYGRPVAQLDRRDASAFIERLQSRRHVTELAS